MNLTVYATTLVITLVENVKLGYGFMYQLNTCQKLTDVEKNVYGYIMTTLEMCVLKDVGENGRVVKESHRTSLVGSPN